MNNDPGLYVVFVLSCIVGVWAVAYFFGARIRRLGGDILTISLPAAVFYAAIMISVGLFAYGMTQRYNAVRSGESFSLVVDGLTGDAWICHPSGCRKPKWE